MQVIASDEVIQYRLQLCNTCEEKKHNFCSKCGCLIEAKVRVCFTKCPLNKWEECKPKDSKPKRVWWNW
jgi:hypothetical protein